MDETVTTASLLGDEETFEVHIRLGANGEAVALTSTEIKAGNSLEDYWDGDDCYRDFSVRVTARKPLPIDAQPPVVADLTIADNVGTLSHGKALLDAGGVLAVPA